MKRTFQIALALSVAGCAFAGQVSTDFHTTNGVNMVTVIVQFSSTPTAALFSLLAGNGATTKKQFNHIPKVQVISIPTRMVGLIAQIPGVKFVTPDRQVVKHLDLTAATVGSNIANQYGWTGKGIGVAVIDSGIDATNADLKTSSGVSRVVYSEDFTGEGTTADLYGHGSHVAGIVGGNGANSGGKYAGIAPNVSLINLRVLDETGTGADSSVIAAIDRAIQLQSTYNIRVINLSLGRPIFESFSADPLCQAVEAAYQAGIVVVVAAGNDGRDNSVNSMGYGTVAAPGNDPFVITVGAMKTEGTNSKSDDMVASYSSKGPTVVDHFVKPDLVAPGNIVSSLRVAGGTLDVANPGNRIDPVRLPRRVHAQVLQPQRNQHGHAGGGRGRGAPPPAKPGDDTGPGEGPPDADREQELPGLLRRGGPRHAGFLHRLL